ncbi:hypothetical protein Q0590_36550 [Rhodocytophaga aerolata]|uniref:DUF4178 domain-containing protein n=1 Tax=Rhodocytophaga aerolata TaxID=455078 RepID=A0ABT8RKE1_9BACT|nr:hypothetical protein [Rhodocytophaga aerolata]MDO1451838.1 hypothetical protein [Rhodocytophaga aerolata]
MFDNLRIHPDMLPVSGEEKRLLAKSCAGEFQTKSLHRDLTMIEITKEGRLLWASFDQELYFSDEDLPEEYLVKEGEESLLLMGGFEVPVRKITWVEEKEYTGEVKFYDHVADLWYEFIAHFSNGKLSHIEKASPLPEPLEVDIL